MLIGADDATTTTTSDPELLIEEARERQRRRQRRQVIALVAAGVLVVLGVGVGRMVRGDKAASARKPRAALAVAPRPAVIYEKVETVIRTPHVPTVRRLGMIWASTAAPWAYRELLTIPGKPVFEVGAEPGRDPTLPKLGRVELVYLYDAKANTIYQTGASLLPAHPPSPRSLFRRLFAQPGVRPDGTRMFEGHKVYVVHAYGSTSFGKTSETMYVDTTTYQPLLIVTTGPDLNWTTRVLAYRTLPATATNLRLTSLVRSHPGVRMRPAPPRIDALYGQANQIGTFGGSDLGPLGPLGSG